MHLEQCIRDYGPAHVFWVFAFERNNGLLSNYHTSSRTIELEMIKRYIQQQMVLNQDQSAIATIAMENPHQLQHIPTTKSTTIQSMQLYTDSFPLILQSEYNQSWYQLENGDPYPYATIQPLQHQLQPQSQPSETMPTSLVWDTPPPMSTYVSPPCQSCNQLVDDLSMIKTEDRIAAVAFMPSSPELWREFKQ